MIFPASSWPALNPSNLMHQRIQFTLWKNMVMLLLIVGLTCLGVAAESGGGSAPAAGRTAGARDFSARAGTALQAMREKAEQLHVGGAAVVAYFDGAELRGWTSSMLVVDRYKDAPSPGQAGANLLAIAYAKAAEMADTLKDSGHAGRPVLTGEFGWQGGVVRAWNRGYLIAAFSGGKSEDDVEVSKAGVLAMTGAEQSKASVPER
jgi:hypothetical protein